MDNTCSRRGQNAGLKPAIYFLWAASLLLVTGLPAHAQAPRDKDAPDLLHQLSNTVEALAKRVAPAVVKVLVTGYGPLEEDSGQTNTGLVVRQRSLGSGVILDPNGYIITNAHVVESAQRVRVALAPAPPATSESSGTLVPDEPKTSTVNAAIVGVDKETDLALLKIDATGLPTLPLGDARKLRQGQVVLAFGSPLGLENSVTMGVISSGTPRQLQPDRPLVYIQTDAPINPGNSGGPLVDVDGQVVGINTFILTQSGGNEGLGFAIPSNVVQIIYQQLRKYGHVHRGEIGVSIQTITPTLAEGLGLPQSQSVIVADVVPGGPAEAAGVQIQDIVLRMDGKPVDNARQFQVNVYMHREGDQVKLEILRGSEKMTLDVPVIERHDEIDRLADLVDPEKSLIPKLGIIGIEINNKISELVSGLRRRSGVIVAGRAAGGAATEIPLLPGDVIHWLNRTPIVSLDELRSGMDRLKVGDSVVVQVERQGKLLYVAFSLE